MEHAPKKHAPRCIFFLKKPIFNIILVITVDRLAPGHHGYNVYVKVLEAELSTAKKQDQSDLKIVQGRVGDSTGVINVRVVGGNFF